MRQSGDKVEVVRRLMLTAGRGGGDDRGRSGRDESPHPSHDVSAKTRPAEREARFLSPPSHSCTSISAHESAPR